MKKRIAAAAVLMLMLLPVLCAAVLAEGERPYPYKQFTTGDGYTETYWADEALLDECSQNGLFLDVTMQFEGYMRGEGKYIEQQGRIMLPMQPGFKDAYPYYDKDFYIDGSDTCHAWIWVTANEDLSITFKEDLADLKKEFELLKSNWSFEDGGDNFYRVTEEADGSVLFELYALNKYSDPEGYHEVAYRARIFRIESLPGVHFVARYKLTTSISIAILMGIENAEETYNNILKAHKEAKEEFLVMRTDLYVTDPANYVVEWKEPKLFKEFEYEEVEEEAAEDPGENNGSEIPAAIAIGVIGAAAGIAGAAASAGGGGDKDGGKKSKFALRINKEFGNTIRVGERVAVYARVVEIRNGVEKRRDDLTERITIKNHDDVFITWMQDALAGEYRGAWVEVNPDNAYAEYGVIDFIFEGRGGVFKDMVKFKVLMPGIKFYQDNIALRAKDEAGAEVGFTVEGVDPEKCRVDLEIRGGESYVAALCEGVNEEGKRVPGAYYAVLADINEEEGEPGTSAEYTLRVTAYDDKVTVSGEIDIYRVTPGLNMGVCALNCYRTLRKTAAGKRADELTPEDFDMSYTKVPAMILKVNDESKEMYYVPAMPQITIEPEDPDDELMRERLEGLGIDAVLTDIKDSISEYTFYCTKGWVEAPVRLKVKLTAVVRDEDEDEHYQLEKPVMLLSQPKREKVTDDDRDRDLEVQNWVADTREFISENLLMEDLEREYLMLGELWDAYDENFGYDPLTVTEIQENIQDCLWQKRRDYLERRQDRYLKEQETAQADNNAWTIWSKSFAMVSDEYLDTWKGLAARIALGICTGGLSEIAFTAMDVNKAVSAYNERTLLCDRTTKGKLIAGSVPIVLSVATAGVIKGTTWSVKVLTPSSVKVALKSYAVKAVGAVAKRIPENWKLASETLVERFRGFADKINSYDPRRKMAALKEAAARADAKNVSAKMTARSDIAEIHKGARSELGKLKSAVHSAGEVNAARKIARFKAAFERAKRFPNDAMALRELKEATIAIDKDSLAIKLLNAEGKTEADVIANAKVKSALRAAYNQAKTDLIENPALKRMTEKAAKIGHTSKDKIVVRRATGRTAAQSKQGLSSPWDSDNSPMMIDPDTGMPKYFTQAETNEIVATSYCEITDTPYTSVDDAIVKSGELKAVGVTPESPEFYRQFERMKGTTAFDEHAINANMKTGRYKMAFEFEQVESKWQALVKDTAKKQRVLAECEAFRSGKLDKLSSETLEVIGYAEKQVECQHQVAKTFDLYVGKDVNAQAFGFESGLSEKSRVFAETCRFSESSGKLGLDIGEMHDLLSKRGTTYSESVSDMVLDFKTVNTNCAAANGTEAKWLYKPEPLGGVPGAVHGVSEAIGGGNSGSGRNDDWNISKYRELPKDHE